MAEFTGTITLSDYEAETILTTAVEGGIGYWSLITDCERNRDESSPDYLSWISVDLVDAEDEDNSFGTVNKAVIEKGVSLIITGKVKITDDLRAQVFTLLSGETWDRDGVQVPEFDIDASAADCIVQAGLFGEIVYG